MKFLEACKSLVVSFTALFSTSPFSDISNPQTPLVEHLPNGPQYDSSKEYPVHFEAPSGPDAENPAPPFNCTYTFKEPGWRNCSTATDRTCWLINDITGDRYDIKTNYENKAPPGKVRKYTLDLGEKTINADGVNNTDGKVFNNMYPGPWIQSCWGDSLEIRVKNHLDCNGTTIHWHGIRQLNSVHMDGVNGITQCPIAPNKEATYKFHTTQYGSSWYHSHYSLQYGDGAAGPMTIYGPSSDHFDEALDPILVTDWSHQSAFKDYIRELTQKPGTPKSNSVLINGKGNFAGEFNLEKFSRHIKEGKKYLMRIINTSVDTAYIFSIDNHNLKVISADFVPIEPYTTDHILVGIGQRYHIILEAKPIASNGWLSSKGNYWLRAIPADGCKAFEPGNQPDERQGIIRYNKTEKSVPVSWRPDWDLTCRDEPYDKLQPKLSWDIPPKALPDLNDYFEVGLQKNPGKPHNTDDFSMWFLANHSMWIDFGRPTIDFLSNKTWNDNSVIVESDAKADDWIILVVTQPIKNLPGGNPRRMIPTAHPIHLHGHDFALLAQGNNWEDLNNPNKEVPLKWNNPPRRDVALLPKGGYLIMAFKADNPGIWIVHCHIAWHASSGLAMQIIERKEDLKKLLASDALREDMEQHRRVCHEWDDWFAANETRCALPPNPFQDDSGI